MVPVIPPGVGEGAGAGGSGRLYGMTKLWLAQEPAADEMLRHDPLALITAMLLDQQIPLEKAFVGPYRLAERMGVERLNATAIADYEPEAFAQLFSTPPAIHRFPGSMAERTQKLARAIADDYDGDAATIWTGAADGKDLFKRLSALPGFGKMKAQIFIALLGKQFGVQPAGWREVAGAYGEEGSLRSVADIRDAASLAKVREFKKQMKADAKAAKA
ncbi:HhH-GPD-type base excision DNA repair protein [Saccharothrix algeriensis]|uniref:(Fe-S)-cluster assembly protein n=2 Tax=Catellatospora bangladeshensis TaxID=310355 RepID=A0A8J3JII4_9ACTN|nr:(Fe-S)-cluster assembly protein [Catellatospora bangladeshensis]